MRTRLLLCLGLAFPIGCGAPAIVDASRTIAGMRGCEAAELTVADTGGSYAVVGCGAAAAYRCEDGSCAEAEGDPQAASAERAHAALAEIESDVLSCTGGDPLTVQVHLVDGRPRGFNSEPQADGDVRLCVGRILLAQVGLEPGGADLLVAHRFGQPVIVQAPADPVESAEEATPQEAQSPDGVPVDADHVEAGEADSAAAGGASAQ